MSDEQMPPWVQAMEDRLSNRIVENIKGLETIFDARAEAREHHLLTEITRAITDSEARLTRRLDEIREDIGVNMARADLAHTKIDADRAEVASLRREMAGLYRRLQDVEHRLFKGGPKPPEAA